ncbi:MAG: hypothetical protein AB7J28_00665 [Hyphomonadaceae bacterium]
MTEQVAVRRAESLEQAIEERLDIVLQWLRENANKIGEEQRHLDAGSAERAYWHHGYAAALQDIKDCLPGKNVPKI